MERELRIPLASEFDMQYGGGCCAPRGVWAMVVAFVSIGAANYGYTDVFPYSFLGGMIVFMTMGCCVYAAHRGKVRWDLDATHLVITYPVAGPAVDYGTRGHMEPA